MSYTIPTLEELLNNGVHFGHKESKWHPNAKDYIYTCRNGVHIIDLTKTQEHLKKALTFLEESAKENKLILFVGTKKATKKIVKKYAEEYQHPHVAERWLGGTITNFKSIYGLIKRLETIESQESDPSYVEKYTKRERLVFTVEKDRLLKMIGGIRTINRIPDVLFLTDIRIEKTALREAQRKGIAVVALVDTNVDPTGINYIIPANDDSVKSVECIFKLACEAVAKGKTEASVDIISNKKSHSPEENEVKEDKSNTQISE